AKSGVARTAGPVQKQWRLTFENHAVLLYFLNEFRNGRFKIHREFCEVRVLRELGDCKVTFLDYSDRDCMLRYVLDQLPHFSAPTDSVLWRFPVLPPPLK